MENYVKALLYSYPKMERMEEDFVEHIKNKAYASYDNRKSAERLVEYVAGEVIKRALLSELRERTERVLKEVSEKETFLLEMRYFRRRGRIKAYREKFGADAFGSRRNYFRRQERLLKKLTGLFHRAGFTEERFLERYSSLEGVMSVFKYIEAGKDEKMNVREQAILRFLEDGRE